MGREMTMTTLTFSKVFDFASLPANFHVVNVSIDWSLHPIILLHEQDDHRTSSVESYSVVHWKNSSPTISKLGTGASDGKNYKYYNVQPRGDGWLLVRADGLATILGPDGSNLATLRLGGGNQDVQTTLDGRIWVSYGDEAVFGEGIGTEGLVCFDAAGDPLFKYNTYARARSLPDIADCYCINVTSNDEVWLCYYEEFPMVCLKDFEVRGIWARSRASPIYWGFAIATDRVTLLTKDGLIARWSLGAEAQGEIFLPVDDTGSQIRGIRLRSVGRGSQLILYNETAIFQGR